MIDFKKIIDESKMTNIINPREIFMSLPNKKYDYPRDVQTEVWQQWMDKRDEKDIIIKMNTGSGKTIVGLIILMSCVREEKKPAVYIVPNNFLVKQVEKEAESMGIPVTEDINDVGFITGEKILITNIYKLVNGKTVFGKRSNGNNFKIGSILIDDVHACINDIESQYTIEINNSDKNYEKIYKVFEDEMKKQYPNRVTDIENNIPGVNILIPYWSWQNKSNEIYKILSDDTDNVEVSMKLPLFRDYFNLCNCVISYDKIEISPKSININEIDGFKRAQRRIYMSATIVEIDSLISKCGITNYPQNVIKPKYSDDMGERFILFPQMINKEITDEEIKNKLKEYSKQYNVVVLVPSDIRKRFWEDVADLSVDKNNLEKEVERLRNEHVGLIVMSNKYEGIDLPNKACEILVIDGIPNSKRKYDEIEQQMIGNSEKILNKKIQLIEQGMGRGVRSSGDYCAIVLMGQGLISTLYADGYIDKMSGITKEQIKLSNEIAKQLSGQPIDEIFESLNYCLKRDQNWIETSKKILSQVKYVEEIQKSDIENILSECFELAKSGEYDICVAKLQDIINKQDDNDLKGFLKMQLAEYYNFIDKTKSQEILKSAHSLNNKIIKPMTGITYKKDITKINKQAKNIETFLEKNNYDFNKIIIKLRAILNDLIFSPNTHKAFEEAIKRIAEFIGIESERPENDTGKGPDNLYWIENKYAMIIECKNEVSKDNNISKTDCNQLNGSNEWFNNNYGKSGIKGIPILIHPSNIYNKECSPNENTRIMKEDNLEEFKKNVYEFIIELSKQDNYNDIKKIEVLLKNNGLYEKQVIENYTEKYIISK
jgi:hypothetical protein